MKTNFQCIELTIQDEEFGCTITFSDSRSADDQFKSMEEIMNSDEKYLLIQRTYPEDDYDADYYYIESSESDEIFKPNEKNKHSAKPKPNQSELCWRTIENRTKSG